MMAKLLTFIYGLIYISALPVYRKKYLCELNETIFLSENEIAFFESKFYPLANPVQTFPELYCKLNISMTSSQNSTNVLIVAYNKITFQTYFTNFFVLNSSYSLVPDSLDDIKTLAVQGFALHEDLNNNQCPLESIAGEEPFEISDETEIIYIRSTHYENEIRQHPCKWKFNATIQYGFKIVIEIFDTSGKIEIRNSTDMFVVNDLIIPSHPFYNQDNYIEISLSTGNQMYQPVIEFKAYISIFKKQYHITDANCNVDEKDYWSNNVFDGYKNNAKCSYSKKILPNHGVHVRVDEYLLEKHVDYVYYYIQGESTRTILTGINTGDSSNGFVIEGKINDTEKYAVFEFVSDGSVQFSGFGIAFQDYVCQCSTVTVIPCHLEETLDEKTIMDSVDYYCGNLNCHFTFEPCDGLFLYITIFSESFDDNDIFTFLSNNETVLEINKDNRMIGAFKILLNPANQNELQVATFSSEAYRRFSMYYNYADGPSLIFGVMLSEENPSYFVTSGPSEQFSTTVAIIEMSEVMASKNLSFIIYANFPMTESNFQLYNNESLSINLSRKNCFAGENPLKCVLNMKKFVIGFKDGDHGFGQDIAVRLSKKTKSCVFEENIFVATRPDVSQTIAALANSEDQCLVKLLVAYNEFAGQGFVITHLFTTALNENVKMYYGNDTKNLLFEFNSKTMEKWKNIGLFSTTFMIEIPKNSAVFLVLKSYDFFEEKLSISPFPSHSMIASCFLGSQRIHNVQSSYDSFVHYNIGNIPVKFTAIYYNMLPDDFFYFQINDDYNHGDVTIAFGEAIIFQNQNVSLVYNRISSHDGSNGFIFFLETMHP